MGCGVFTNEKENISHKQPLITEDDAKQTKALNTFLLRFSKRGSTATGKQRQLLTVRKEKTAARVGKEQMEPLPLYLPKPGGDHSKSSLCEYHSLYLY